MDLQKIEIFSYLIYFSTSIIILLIFTKLYLILTPYDELKLIRQGKGAACISLSGTLIGFTLTLAASAIYNNSLIIFITWACLAIIVQLLGYLVIVRVIGNVEEKISQNNIAVGALIGVTGLILGIINAGCLS